MTVTTELALRTLAIRRCLIQVAKVESQPCLGNHGEPEEEITILDLPDKDTRVSGLADPSNDTLIRRP